MDESTFTGEGVADDEKFWLFGPDVTQDVLDIRKDLGELHGWFDERWYEDVNNLKVLWDELKDNYTAVLDKLEQAGDDYSKVEALKEVVGALTPADDAKDEEHGESDTTAAPAAAPAASAGSAADASASPEAPKKTSLFARKPQTTDSTVRPAPADSPAPAPQGGPVDLESLEAGLRDKHGEEFEQRLADAEKAIEERLAAAIQA